MSLSAGICPKNERSWPGEAAGGYSLGSPPPGTVGTGGAALKIRGEMLGGRVPPEHFFLSPAQDPEAEGQAEHKTGSGLEVHPYNIYYWRRMNHFPIYGPLTVEGGEISLTRRNIYVVLRDVLTGWQRCRRGLPAPLSAPGDRPAHVPPQHHAAPELILNVSSAPQHKGANPRRTPPAPQPGADWKDPSPAP